MKELLMGLWSIWISGLLLISLSLYATQNLPSHSRGRLNLNSSCFGDDIQTPRITLFTAPAPFTGSAGANQRLALRSWLALSPQITVVLFSQHPSVASNAAEFGSRVLVEPNIDFTFLGTPFFHSMVARSRAFGSDVHVFINPQTIVLHDFVSAINYGHKLDRDWLLYASSPTVAHFPFTLDEDGRFWVKQDGQMVGTRELQKALQVSSQQNACEENMLIAWNMNERPLHHGVHPPFVYGRGAHKHWLVNEAWTSGIRFVFDASWAISTFSLNHLGNESKLSPEISNPVASELRNWEYAGNTLLAELYGSSFFHEANFSSMMKLLNCYGHHLFVNGTEDIVSQCRKAFWKGTIFCPFCSKNVMVQVDGPNSPRQTLGCSFKDLMPVTELKHPFSLESLLSINADHNRTIILTVAGYSYKDMLMSWICRLRHLSIRNFLVCALDHETYQFSILQGLPVFTDPSSPSNISFNNCHFGTQCFQRVTKMKSRIVLKILKLGYNVLFSDVDVYWHRNPLQYLYSFGPAVLLAQSDEYKETGPINLPRRLNSGFYFAHADSATVSAIGKVVKHAATSSLSEQPSFYDTLCGEGGSNRAGDNMCVEPETNLTVHFLDRNLFPNGAYLGLWLKKDVKEACKKVGCLVLHNNWISGRLKKLERQVNSALWDYDVASRMCLQRLPTTKQINTS